MRPRSSSWQSNATIPLLGERTAVSRRSSSRMQYCEDCSNTLRMSSFYMSRRSSSRMQYCEDCSNTLRMSSFYITICGRAEHVLRVRVRSMSATVTSGHGIILILFSNVGIRSTSASAFGLESSETWSWAPTCYLTQWYRNFLETVVPGLLGAGTH
jgi:hypothetical protein